MVINYSVTSLIANMFVRVQNLVYLLNPLYKGTCKHNLIKICRLQCKILLRIKAYKSRHSVVRLAKEDIIVGMFCIMIKNVKIGSIPISRLLFGQSQGWPIIRGTVGIFFLQFLNPLSPL